MRFAPISTYDVAAWQAWLEDMAAKGYFLDGPGLLTTFTKGEPKAVRYRMEPVMRKGEACPDKERQEIYGQLGWEYVDSNGTFHFWRCDDPNAPELNTDPQVQGAAYDRLCRQLKKANWIIAAIFAVVLGLPILYIAHLSSHINGMNLPHSWRPLWEVTIAWAAMLLVGGQSIYWEVSLRRYIRMLKAGVPMPQRRPYRVSRILAAVTFVVYLAFVTSRWIAVFRPNSRPFEPISTFEETVPYVELPGMGEVQALKWKNWKTPEQWWMVQENEDGDRAQTRYYECYTQRSAKKLAMEIVDYYEMVPMEDTGLNGVWWKPADENNLQLFVVWNGDKVIDLAYVGAETVTDYLDDYKELLTEK